MKHISKGKKIIGVTLILLGLITIISVNYLHYKGQKTNQTMVEQFENLAKAEGEKNSSTSALQAPSNSQEIPPEVPQTEQEKQKRLILGGRTMAVLAIPKIDLKVAVAEGTDYATLNYFVGHFAGTAQPGNAGNFCLAGHRNYTYNEFFKRIDELAAGDEIIVTTLKGEFKYKVTESKTVPPEEVSVLDSTKNASITLVTCTPKHNPTHRLVVKGELAKN